MTWIQYEHTDDLLPSQGKRAQFTATVERTEQLLEDELRLLKADRHNGDRGRWEAVINAARDLGVKV